MASWGSEDTNKTTFKKKKSQFSREDEPTDGNYNNADNYDSDLSRKCTQ